MPPHDGNLSLICGCALLRADGHTVLVDTGLGPAGQGRLPAELDAAGVAPGEIDLVVFTHLHGDHTGWNIDRESGQPFFPAAKYWIPQGDWDHFGAQGGEGWETLLAPLERAGQTEVFDGETMLSPSLTLLPTPGHTPGHTSIAIVSGGERSFVLGDVVVGEINLREPDWTNSFDGDHPTAAATRKRIIDRLTTSGELVIASHLGVSGLGHIRSEAGAGVWREL